MTEPVRVLHVLNDLKMGGGQQFVLNLMSSADPLRVRSGVCYLEPAEEMGASFREAGFSPVALDHRGGALSVRTVRRLVRLIRRERIQVLHGHSSLDKHYAQIAGILCRVPVVSQLNMPYDYLSETSPKARLRAFVRKVGGWLSVKQYIAISRTVWSAHKDHVPGGRISFIPYGIPLGRFGRVFSDAEVKRVRREIGVGDASPIIVNMGRLARQKRQDVLIPMMSRILERWPEARLLIIGEGPERSVLEEQVRAAGLTDKILLLGTRSDVELLLAISDVFVFPSRSEGYGLALAEALAAGKPSVVANLPVLAELIEEGETGFLVEPTPDALAGAVLEILNDPERARAMAAAARRFAKERCDLDTCVRGITEVYERVAKAAGVRR
jgi:glycosyltransferase involved in cell wall biosynthesis